MTTTKSITCGLCHLVIAGAVRQLNMHKATAHPEERAAMRAARKARLRRGASINHCSNCAKFVSLELTDPEDQGFDIGTDEMITGDVRMLLSCADCGSEMADATVSFEEDAELEHTAACQEEERELTLDGPELDYDEEGGGRFSKHLYMVKASMSVKCETCGAERTLELTSEKVASSYFESCQ